MSFTIKRVYEPAKSTDGSRVLVDRLWPRGLKKTDAHLDHWMKEVAPSPRLRQWFNHEPERFAEFRRRYEAELAKNPAVAELRELGKKAVTLLYAAHDPQVNHAVVLLSFLGNRGGARTSAKARRARPTVARAKSAVASAKPRGAHPKPTVTRAKPAAAHAKPRAHARNPR
jgi:uncharacterized protein YeaO (DUF488 family)